MAIQFTENASDYYSLASAPALPGGNAGESFVVGVWTKVDDNTGSLYQYAISTGIPGSNDNLTFWLNEDSSSLAGQWSASVKGGSSPERRINSSSAPGGDGKWRLIIFQMDYDGGTTELLFCEQGGTPASQGTEIQSNADVPSATWRLGGRSDGNVDRAYGGILGELFVLSNQGILTSSEIKALGAGATIWQLGYTPDMYVPMASAESTLYSLTSTHTATKTGSPTTGEEPPIRRLGAVPILVSTAAVSGGTTVTKTASLGAILSQQGILRTAQLDAILQQTITLTSSLDSVLQKTGSESASLDAILQKTVSLTSSLDAILQSPSGTQVRTASLDAILQGTITVVSQLDAVLQKTNALTAQFDSVLLLRSTLTASLGAVLSATGLTKTASLDAVLQNESGVWLAISDASTSWSDIAEEGSTWTTITKDSTTWS